MAEWYLRRGEKVSGPYSKERVKELAQSGKLQPDDEMGPSPNGPFKEVSEVPGLVSKGQEDDFYEPPQERKSGKRKKKSSSNVQTILIVLAVVGCVIVVGCGVGTALLLPAVQQAREAARRSQSRNNLKMQGLAFHNYHDTYNRYPFHPQAGQKKHSFLTGMLPFVEHASTIQQIDLKKEWDASENQAPMQTQVECFLNPGIETDDRMAGDYAAAHYAGNRLIFGGSNRNMFGDITDGLSNTVVIGEVREGFKPWGDPSNVRDLEKGLGQSPDQFNPGVQTWTCLFGDAAVRSLSKDVDPKVLKALATPSAGDRVPLEF